MKQPVGIIEVVNGIPVRSDDAGTLVELQSDPYLLTDGVSLEAPIPVTFVSGNSYVDTAGNLRGVWLVKLQGSPPEELENAVVVNGETVVVNGETVVHTE